MLQNSCWDRRQAPRGSIAVRAGWEEGQLWERGGRRGTAPRWSLCQPLPMRSPKAGAGEGVLPSCWSPAHTDGVGCPIVPPRSSTVGAHRGISAEYSCTVTPGPFLGPSASPKTCMKDLGCIKEAHHGSGSSNMRRHRTHHHTPSLGTSQGASRPCEGLLKPGIPLLHPC